MEFERHQPDSEIATAIDGVWWALVTATTVGYGDMVPLTPEGRGLAVLLMLVGIGLLSVVTANVAAYFVEDTEDTEQLRRLEARLERMEALLASAHGSCQGGQPARNAARRAADTDHVRAPEHREAPAPSSTLTTDSG